MKNRTIIILGVVAAILAVPGMIWMQNRTQQMLGVYRIDGHDLPLAGFQVKSINNGPKIGAATFLVTEDGPALGDLPFAAACAAVLASPPEIPFFRTASLASLRIVHASQTRTALVFTSNRAITRNFDVSSGTCMELGA